MFLVPTAAQSRPVGQWNSSARLLHVQSHKENKTRRLRIEAKMAAADAADAEPPPLPDEATESDMDTIVTSADSPDDKVRPYVWNMNHF